MSEKYILYERLVRISMQSVRFGIANAIPTKEVKAIAKDRLNSLRQIRTGGQK